MTQTNTENQKEGRCKTENSAWLKIFTLSVWVLVLILSMCLVHTMYLKQINKPKEITVVYDEKQDVQKLKQKAYTSYNNWLVNLSKKYKTNVEDVKETCVIIEKYCEKYSLYPPVIIALVGVESNFRSKAVSYKGWEYGNGLMQVSYVVLKEYNKKHKTKYMVRDLYKKEVNIEVGCWYYSRLHKVYKIKNTKANLSAYNMGPNSRRYNARYVNGVMNNLKLLRFTNF